MTTTTPPSSSVRDLAVANQQKAATGAKGLLAKYRDEFALVLPSHMDAATFVRVTQGALKKGKMGQDGLYDLERAANNNIGAFLSACLTAAQLGLSPGTEQFYLTVRSQEIMGIIGYQGYIELMYRAGAVRSVVCEVVRENDHFEFNPGRDELPDHRIDWHQSDEERGELYLVYAFARLEGGVTSRVSVLTRSDVENRRSLSDSWKNTKSRPYSPWTLHTKSMWMKSSIRELQKWVPTSGEYIREKLRAAQDVMAERGSGARVALDADDLQALMGDSDAGSDVDVVDAELVGAPEHEPTPANPDVEVPRGPALTTAAALANTREAATPPATPAAIVSRETSTPADAEPDPAAANDPSLDPPQATTPATAPEAPEPDGWAQQAAMADEVDAEPATNAQKGTIASLFRKEGILDDDRYLYCGYLIGRSISSLNGLTKKEAGTVITPLKADADEHNGGARAVVELARAAVAEAGA